MDDRKRTGIKKTIASNTSVSDAAPIRILLVEDVPADAELIEYELSKAKLRFTLRRVEREQEFLTALREFNPDIILSDYLLPEFDGITAIQLTRKYAPEIPLILVTGSMNELTAVECMRAGAADYVLKDHLLHLGQSVRSTLDKKKARMEHLQTERQLEENEKRYHDLAELLPQPLFETDQKGRLVFANRASLETFGYTEEDISRNPPVFKMISPRDRKRAMENFRELYEGGSVFGSEYEAVRKDGTSFPVLIYSSPIRHDDRVIGVRGIVMDLSLLKKTERKLALSAQILDKINTSSDVPTRDLLQEILCMVKEYVGCSAIALRLKEENTYPYYVVNGLPDLFVGKDLCLRARDESGVIIRKPRGNVLLECICGTDGDGKTDPTLFSLTKGGSFWTNHLSKLLAGDDENKPQPGTGNPGDDGEYESVALVPLQSGKVTIGLLQLHDRRPDVFTAALVKFLEEIGTSIGVALARKKAEEEILRERDFSTTLIQSSPAFFVAVDAIGRTLMMNTSLLTALGYHHHEVFGADYLATFVPPEERDPIRTAFDRIRTLREKIAGENHIMTKNGRQLLVEWHGVPVTTSRGDFEYLFIVGNDITEHRRSEDLLVLRLRYEKGLAACSRALLKDTPGGMEEALRHLLDASGISRVSIFENGGDETTGLWGRLTHEVCAEGITPQAEHPRLKHVFYAPDLLRWREELSRDGTIQGLVKSFPSSEQNLLRPQGILSLLMLPLRVGGRWYGFIGFDDMKTPREWSEENVLLLKTGAEMIGNHLHRQETENRLRETVRFQQTLIDTIPAPIFYKDRQSRYIGCNKAFEKLFGARRDTIVGKTVFDITTKPSAGSFHTQDEELFAKPGIQIYEVRLRDTSGTMRDVVYHKATFTDGNGEVAGIIGAILDITDVRKAEEEILTLSRSLENIIETTNVWISSFDPRGNILLWNKAAEQITGYAVDAVKGNDLIWEWLFPDEETRRENRQILMGVIERKMPVENFETTILRKDSVPRVILWNARRLDDQTGTAIGAIAVGMDITERRMLQEQLLQSEKLAALGEMLSGIAHEINNPLTGIVGFSRLLDQEETGGSPERQEYVRFIREESERIAKIVANILAFSRKQTPKKEKLSVAKIIQTVMALKNYEFSVNNITVYQSFEENLPSIEADALQIQQVFLNIINNAEQAMLEANKRGTITIKGTVRESFVRVSFTDDGPGIPPEILPKIFNPFFTTKPVGKGTGLGLSMSYGIIKQHNGVLSAESEHGKGTTFIVELPIHPGKTYEQQKDSGG